MKPGIVLALVLLLAACTRGHPVYNVQDHPIPQNARQFPLERIEALIVEAGAIRDWRMTREGPGHLSATHTDKRVAATVDIRFDQDSYSIVYRSSSNLHAENGTIHQRYNMWIGNLEADIDATLYHSKP
jgi:hypothetical protein